MGYESKLYVIQKYDCVKQNDKIFAEVIAMFDLCKVNDIDFSKYPATDCYIYDVDGNTKITEDMYGEPLKELTISDAIIEIERAMTKGQYRRWNPILGLLKGFNEDEWDNGLSVLHYGY